MIVVLLQRCLKHQSRLSYLLYCDLMRLQLCSKMLLVCATQNFFVVIVLLMLKVNLGPAGQA